MDEWVLGTREFRRGLEYIATRAQQLPELGGLVFISDEIGHLTTAAEFEDWFPRLDRIERIAYTDADTPFVFLRALKHYLQRYKYRIFQIKVEPSSEDTRRDNASMADLFWEGIYDTSIGDISIPGSYYHDPALVIRVLCSLTRLKHLKIYLINTYSGKQEMFHCLCEYLRAQPNKLESLILVGDASTGTEYDIFWDSLIGSTSLRTLGISLSMRPRDLTKLADAFRSFVNLETLALTDYRHRDEEFDKLFDCIPLLPRLRCISMEHDYFTRRHMYVLKKALEKHPTIEKIIQMDGAPTAEIPEMIALLRSEKVLTLCALMPIYSIPRLTQRCVLKMLPKDLLRKLIYFI